MPAIFKVHGNLMETFAGNPGQGLSMLWASMEMAGTGLGFCFEGGGARAGGRKSSKTFAAKSSSTAKQTSSLCESIPVLLSVIR